MKAECLLPCPFCGGKSIDMWPMRENTYQSPVCEDCGATIHENYGTPETTDDMMNAWNRRVDNT